LGGSCYYGSSDQGAKYRLSTDCSDKSFVFSKSAPRSRSSQWFIASRLGRVVMLKAGCGHDCPPRIAASRKRKWRSRGGTLVDVQITMHLEETP
jgi:hypothetical protein